MEDGGFTVVQHRRNQRGRSAKWGKRPTHANRFEPTQAPFTQQACRALETKVQSAKQQLTQSLFLHELKSHLPNNIHQLACFGIGNFADVPAATFQVALSFILYDHVRQRAPPGQDVDFNSYDPIFSELEKGFLERCHCHVPKSNEEGRRCAPNVTLFFMPHCGRQLYANLLRANWSIENLQRLIIIGNSFEEYCIATHGAENGDLISRAAEFVTETSLSGTSPGRFANAFCSIRLHTFDPSHLSRAPDPFWRLDPESPISASGELLSQTDIILASESKEMYPE